MASENSKPEVDEQEVRAHFNKQAEIYEGVQGVATGRIAKHLMTLSPPFTKDSFVLDNATGTGIVIEEIQKHISASTPSASSSFKVPILATDASEAMISFLNTKISLHSNEWPQLGPIDTKIVPAEKLTSEIVKDNSITHSYTNLGVLFFSDALASLKHIYRSLAPGGTAFVTTWHELAHVEAIRRTEAIMNPQNDKFGAHFDQRWLDPEYLKALLVQAGFEENKVKMSQEPSYLLHRTLGEICSECTERFAGPLRGKGFETEEEKELWLSELIRQAKVDPKVVKESYKGGEGVGFKMIANIAVCVK